MLLVLALIGKLRYNNCKSSGEVRRMKFVPTIRDSNVLGSTHEKQVLLY